MRRIETVKLSLFVMNKNRRPWWRKVGSVQMTPQRKSLIQDCKFLQSTNLDSDDDSTLDHVSITSEIWDKSDGIEFHEGITSVDVCERWNLSSRVQTKQLLGESVLNLDHDLEPVSYNNPRILPHRKRFRRYLKIKSFQKGVRFCTKHRKEEYIFAAEIEGSFDWNGMEWSEID
jgi:hypothetical protein